MYSGLVPVQYSSMSQSGFNRPLHSTPFDFNLQLSQHPPSAHSAPVKHQLTSLTSHYSPDHSYRVALKLKNNCTLV